jgi:hypothetical protein
MLYEIIPSEYFKKCVEICWHFVIQDPPMYLVNVSLKGTKIDKDTHKVYTKSGDIVKYHVWPALYLKALFRFKNKYKIEKFKYYMGSNSYEHNKDVLF